jgi:hypothetical protein
MSLADRRSSKHFVHALLSILLAPFLLFIGCATPQGTMQHGIRGRTTFTLEEVKEAVARAFEEHGFSSSNQFQGEPGTGEVVGEGRHAWRIAGNKTTALIWVDATIVDLFTASRSGQETTIFTIWPPDQMLKNSIDAHLGAASADYAYTPGRTAPPPAAARSAPPAPPRPSGEEREKKPLAKPVAAAPARPVPPPGEAPPEYAPAASSIRWEAASRTFALIVGISQYAPESGISGIDTSENDALEFQRLLLDGGVPRANITLLRNEQATLGRIKASVRRLRERARDSGDQGIFYFSGHGGPIVIDGRITGGVLIPYDGAKDYLDTTCYNIDRLKEDLGQTEKPVLIVLESCFSGANEIRPPTLGLDLFDEETEKKILEFPSHWVLTATSGESPARFDRDKRKHGIFTYHLLRGLRGRADSNWDGAVDIYELFSFVKAHVERETRSLDHVEQRPQLYSISASSETPGVPPPKVLTRVTGE